MLSKLCSPSCLTNGNQSKPQELTQRLSCSMPAQTIALRAGRKAVVCGSAAAFPALNNVVDFPVAASLAFGPALPLKFDRVPAKVTVPVGLIKDLAENRVGHERHSTRASLISPSFSSMRGKHIN